MPSKIEDTKNDKCTVTNDDDMSIEVPAACKNIFTDASIHNLTFNINNYVQQHNPCGGYSISSSQGTSSFNSQDIKDIAKPFPLDVQESVKCSRIRVTTKLPIKKPDILGSSKWEFKYNNRTISAFIEDEIFLNDVHQGIITIKAGDYINAVLEIYYDINESGEPIESSAKYTVLNVIGRVSSDYENLALPF